MKPLLSVIIPVYKVQDYLERCVNSVINQDFSEMEIILVDDGSPDSCPAICDAFAAKDKRVITIHKTNGGLSSARNKGIENSSGKYLAFLDSDDQWAVGKLNALMQHVLQNDVDMLVFDSIDVFNDGIRRKRNDYNFFSEECLLLDTLNYYAKITEVGNFMESACTKILKRDFILDNNLFFTEGITGEDSEWMLRLLRCSPSIAISNIELFLCTCGRQGSIQNSIKEKNIQDLIATIDKSVLYYKTHKKTEITRFELGQCAYLLANATGLLLYIDDKTNKKHLAEQIKQRTFLFDYAASKKMFKVKTAYKLLGFNMFVLLLEIYMYFLKHNLLNNKKKYE